MVTTSYVQSMRELLDPGEPSFSRQRRPGGKFAFRTVSCCQDLDVGSLDIHDEHFHWVSCLSFRRESPVVRARHFPNQRGSSSAALLEAMTPINSFQDLTNASAPSFCSFAASASTSMPALANWASTASQWPPSAGIGT